MTPQCLGSQCAKFVCLFGFVLCIVFSCSKQEAPQEVVARVNGEAILKSDFDKQAKVQLARYRGQDQALPAVIETRIKQSVLRRMIDDVIVLQKANLEKITVSEPEVQDAFKAYKARFNTPEAFAEYLKKSRHTEDGLVDDLKRGLLRDKLIQQLGGPMTLTDTEIDTYYKENQTRFQVPAQARIWRIVIPVPEQATAQERKAKLKEAKLLRAQVVQSAGHFSKLAEHYSASTKAAGNQEESITMGASPTDFEKAVFALQPKEISPVLTTNKGFEIVQVIDIKSAHVPPLAELKDSISKTLTARLSSEKRREILQNLKSSAQVEILTNFEVPPSQKAPNPNSIKDPNQASLKIAPQAANQEPTAPSHSTK